MITLYTPIEEAFLHDYFEIGRPDRLIVAMTHYNFKSIFA